jgi:hypothetical protein
MGKTGCNRLYPKRVRKYFGSLDADGYGVQREADEGNGTTRERMRGLGEVTIGGSGGRGSWGRTLGVFCGMGIERWRCSTMVDEREERMLSPWGSALRRKERILRARPLSFSARGSRLGY